MGGPKKIRNGGDASSSNEWHDESDALRSILTDCGLDELRKWGKPCFAFEGNNVAIIQKMKAFVALMFFKGVLLKDSKGILKKPGANSNIGRRFEFASVDDIIASKATIERYVREAIEIEKAGLKVPRRQPTLVFPDELHHKFNQDPAFKAAFDALTPGRQRGYNLYFSAPKGGEARARRIDKYRPNILAGKGLHDR